MHMGSSLGTNYFGIALHYKRDPCGQKLTRKWTGCLASIALQKGLEVITWDGRLVAYSYTWAVANILVPGTDLNSVFPACRIMW